MFDLYSIFNVANKRLIYDDLWSQYDLDLWFMILILDSFNLYDLCDLWSDTIAIQ